MCLGRDFAISEISEGMKSICLKYIYSVVFYDGDCQKCHSKRRCSVGLPSGDWKDTSIWITALSYWFLINVCSEPWSTVGVEETTPIRIEMLHHRMKGIILKEILLIFSVMLLSKGTGEAKPCQQNTPMEATTFLFNLSPAWRFIFKINKNLINILNKYTLYYSKFWSKKEKKKQSILHISYFSLVFILLDLFFFCVFYAFVNTPAL